MLILRAALLTFAGLALALPRGLTDIKEMEAEMRHEKDHGHGEVAGG